MINKIKSRMAHLPPFFLLLLLLTLGAALYSWLPVLAAAGDTSRVSVGPGGVEGNGNLTSASISANGRFVAFDGSASNLVANDTNGTRDVFVYDREMGQMGLVSVATGGLLGNGQSTSATISADGRFVAFRSLATNLVANDTNSSSDIFVHDRQTGETERVSVGTGGAEANEASFTPAISANGRYVTFRANASNLVAGDGNSEPDIFVHDRQTGITERVSVDSGGVEGNSASYNPTISADGRYVAFESSASNLVAGDSNGETDIFVHDRQTGTTTRVSVASGGAQANGFSEMPVISADGRFVAFISFATNLVGSDTNGMQDAFLHDRQTGTTERVSVDSNGVEGNGNTFSVQLSANGRYLTFDTDSTNLVSGDTNSDIDIFFRDRLAGTTERISVDSNGAQGTGSSLLPSMTANGQLVAFQSTSPNLVPGDTNGFRDIFVHELDLAPEVVAISRADPDPTEANSVAFTVTFSEVVTGVDAADFGLTLTDTMQDTAVTNVSGTGAVYTVTVSSGTGRGTLRLDLLETAVINDLSGNPLDNLPFTDGEQYTFTRPVLLFLPLVIR